VDFVTAEEVFDLTELPLPAEQGRGLTKEVVWVAFERPEGGKIGRKVRMNELKYSLRIEQIA
jgi:hypothetical protein